MMLQAKQDFGLLGYIYELIKAALIFGVRFALMPHSIGTYKMANKRWS